MSSRQRPAAKKSAARKSPAKKASTKGATPAIPPDSIILSFEEAMAKLDTMLTEADACNHDKWKRLVAKHFFGKEVKTFHVEGRAMVEAQVSFNVVARSQAEAERIALSKTHLWGPEDVDDLELAGGEDGEVRHNKVTGLEIDSVEEQGEGQD